MSAATEANILVVDDDDGGRYVKAHTLAQHGYTVCEAALGQAAIDQIRKMPPDLVLMDVRLPDGDGVEFCRQIKAAFPTVTVLQTSSALISATDRALALEAGADSYLVEPIEPDELIAVVRALLRLREAEQALRQMNDALEVRVTERTGELAEAHRQLLSEQAGRREAESILWHTQKLEAVGQLTGGIAHDFNNLLTIVSGNLELLETVLAGEKRLSLDRPKRLIGAALRAVEHGAQMTQQLLAFARQGVLHEQTVDLNAVIGGMTGFLQRTLGDVVTLEFKPAPGLWLSLIDPVQLEAAVLNLAINARDAMPEGGLLQIELGNVVNGADAGIDLAPGSYVRLNVRDNGTGMAEDIAQRAFEPFFTTKGVGKGSGLGLSQVYGFAVQSGGGIKISSTPGAGTAVTLYLPRSEAAAVDLGGGTSFDATPRGRETILVVEDDDQLRDVAVEMLEELGYRVFTAMNGPEALDRLRADEPIDLLFSDVVMPGGISGVTLASQARKMKSGMAVLLTSGYPAEDRADLARSELPVIQKPYRRDKLAQMLRVALDLRRRA